MRLNVAFLATSMLFTNKINCYSICISFIDFFEAFTIEK